MVWAAHLSIFVPTMLQAPENLSFGQIFINLDGKDAIYPCFDVMDRKIWQFRLPGHTLSAGDYHDF